MEGWVEMRRVRESERERARFVGVVRNVMVTGEGADCIARVCGRKRRRGRGRGVRRVQLLGPWSV